MLLVFGSLNADLLFQVEALPRPGETVLCPGYQLAAGGKGANQATAAAKAGAKVRMVGHVGADSFGQFLRDALAAAGVDGARSRPPTRPPGVAVIGVDRAAENQIIVAQRRQSRQPRGPGRGRPARPRHDLLCQNEVRPEASFALLERAKARARARSSTSPRPARCPGASWTPSTSWWSTRSRRRWPPAAAAIRRFWRAIWRSATAWTCVVTLGGRGALAIGPSGGWRVEALAVEAVDTTGAGDAFTGVLAAALDQGLALPEALRRASVAAGLACTRIGAQTSQPEPRRDRSGARPARRGRALRLRRPPMRPLPARLRSPSRWRSRRCWRPPARAAFCGFYVAKADADLFNQASKVVFARHDGKSVITMVNDYQGALQEFALVVPVPSVLERGQIHVGENALVDHLDAYTAPRLVEYFDEDPCRVARELQATAAQPAAPQDRPARRRSA